MKQGKSSVKEIQRFHYQAEGANDGPMMRVHMFECDYCKVWVKRLVKTQQRQFSLHVIHIRWEMV